MKSLGKKTVNNYHFQDDVQVGSSTETRLVYQDRSGQCWVSYCGSKRGRIAVPKSDGTYEVEFHVRIYYGEDASVNITEDSPVYRRLVNLITELTLEVRCETI